MIREDLEFDVSKDMVRNRRILDWLCEEVGRARELDIALLFAQIAAQFAIARTSGYYSLPSLERPFLILGDALRMPRITNISKGSLHVMTESYPTGGHTQAVAQWFRLCPDNEPATLLLTEQKSEDIPRFLREAVEKRGGRVFSLWDENSDRGFRLRLLRTPEISARAFFMRSLALSHRRVFLSHHMHDPLPITAFGHKDFPRPVFVINHADHLFWLGRSVTDATIEFHEFGHEATKHFRGNPPSVQVPLLLERNGVLSASKNEARERCGLPQDATVILSVGSPWKFFPVAGYDFQDFIRKSLRAVPGALHVIIGPVPDDPLCWGIWPPLLEEAGERLRMPGKVPRVELDYWLKAADIFLSSFPFGGGCALLDAVQYGLPVAGLRIQGNGLSCFSQNGWFSDSVDDLLDAVAMLSEKPEARRALAEEQRAVVNNTYGEEAWLTGAKQILAFPPAHTVTEHWEAPVANRIFEHLMTFMKRLTEPEAETSLLHSLASLQSFLEREDRIRLVKLLKFIDSIGSGEK